VGLNNLIVLFLVGCYCSTLVYEKFLVGFSVVFLEAFHEFEASLGLAWKFFFWHFSVNLSCQLHLALLFSLRRFRLASLKISCVSLVPFSMKFFRASFLEWMRFMRLSLAAVNQLGLEVISFSATSLAASTMWFSKSWSSSLVVSTAVLGSRFWKKSGTFPLKLCFWRFRRMKLSILLLGLVLTLLPSFFVVEVCGKFETLYIWQHGHCLCCQASF